MDSKQSFASAVSSKKKEDNFKWVPKTQEQEEEKKSGDSSMVNS